MTAPLQSRRASEILPLGPVGRRTQTLKTSTTASLNSEVLTSDLVDILQRQAEGLVRGAGRRLNGIKAFQQGDPRRIPIFPCDLPALKPCHLYMEKTKAISQLIIAKYLFEFHS